jgi:tRNA uridine 5-carboxymethylaminomethyl modification enzyme
MLSCVPLAIWELLQTDFKYEGYAARQSEHNQRLDRKRNQKIPDGLDYDKIAGLRSETRQKLSSLRPTSLGQAARISGITPSDISILHIWLNRNCLRDVYANAVELR